MEKENTLAEDIRATDEKARYDAACKRLLSEKVILAWIMKSCLEEFRDCEIQEIAERYIEGQPLVGQVPVAPDETNPVIQGIRSEDTSLTEGTVTYDIRFIATAPGSGEPIRLIINLEAQNRYLTGYPLLKRAIYYCSRMISAQYGTEFTGARHERIRKVYSIWVCVSPPKDHRNTITRYRMTEESMVGRVREPVKDYDLLTVIMLCLGEPDGENYGGVLKLLDVLLSSEIGAGEKRRILKQDFAIPMTETLEQEVNVMCNLSQGVEERGIAKGRAKGLAEGRVEGRATGVTEGILASNRNLMESTGWPAEQAMTVLKIPEAERSKYQELLKECR